MHDTGYFLDSRYRIHDTGYRIKNCLIKLNPPVSPFMKGGVRGIGFIEA